MKIGNLREKIAVVGIVGCAWLAYWGPEVAAANKEIILGVIMVLGTFLKGTPSPPDISNSVISTETTETTGQKK